MPNDLGLVRSERAQTAHDILSPYFTAKKDRTIIGQYKRISAGKGRGRTVLSPVVTETGRLASGESFVDDDSTNLQNLSKKESYKDPLYRVRDCFIADPGMRLVASDLDKAEAVVVAFESGNWDFYDKLISGEDVHTWVAAHAYHGGNQRAVTKAERQRCKNVLYASLYLAGIPKITSTINADATSRADKLTQDDVQIVYDTIMDILELDTWWDHVWNELMDPELYGGVRWLENALGFRRLFYNPNKHKLHKEAVNFFPQSTVASIIDRVMIDWWEALDEPDGAELILQIHDELLWQIDDDLVDDYAPKILDLMQQPFMARGREVYIPAGLKAGHRWDEWRGPEGDDPTNSLGRMTTLHVP